MDARRHRLIQRRGWDRAAAFYERYWRAQLRPVHAIVVAQADLRAGQRVLDVACGSGHVTAAVAAAVAPGRVVATDLAPNMVDATLALASANGLENIEVRCCDAEQLAVDGPFDVALCSLGLMYVPDPSRATAELHRVLRPGGRVAVSVWGERQRCGWADVFGIVDARVASDVCPRFFALGAPSALSGLLVRGGFVDVDEVRLLVELVYRDAAEAVGAAFLGGPVALAYARFDPATRCAVAEEYLASIDTYRDGHGRYRVPGEFVVASARRPPPRHHFHHHNQEERP
jgi:SAM-dependent methyltransferase